VGVSWTVWSLVSVWNRRRASSASSTRSASATGSQPCVCRVSRRTVDSPIHHQVDGAPTVPCTHARLAALHRRGQLPIVETTRTNTITVLTLTKRENHRPRRLCRTPGFRSVPPALTTW